MNHDGSESKMKQQDHSFADESEEETIGRLIQLVGSRILVPHDRMERVKPVVYSLWKDRVQIRKKRKRLLVWSGLVAAAIIAFLVVSIRLLTQQEPIVHQNTIAVLERVVGSVRLQNGRQIQQGIALVPGEDIYTEQSGYAGLHLSSGTSVRMSSSTRLRFLSKNRILLQEGKIYVDSGEHNVADGNGIVIQTNLGVVQELGTQFEVSKGNNLRVRVRQGHVEMIHHNQKEIASVGIELTSSKESIIRRTTSIYGTDWEWILKVSPAFHLDGSTLSEYLNWVSRETGWRIWYAEEQLAKTAPKIVLHGSTGNLHADKTPAVVLPACGLQYRFSDGLLIISSRKASNVIQ